MLVRKKSSQSEPLRNSMVSIAEAMECGVDESDSGPRCHAMYAAASVSRSIRSRASPLRNISMTPQTMGASATQYSFSQ